MNEQNLKTIEALSQPAITPPVKYEGRMTLRMRMVQNPAQQGDMIAAIEALCDPAGEMRERVFEHRRFAFPKDPIGAGQSAMALARKSLAKGLMIRTQNIDAKILGLGENSECVGFFVERPKDQWRIEGNA
jgi:hypothetical protein